MNNLQTLILRGSFPAGFLPLIQDLVRRDHGIDAIVSSDESSIVFKAQNVPTKAGYFVALSRVLDHLSHSNIDQAASEMAKKLMSAQSPSAAALLASARKPRFFALRFFKEGSPTSCASGPRRDLENAIARTLHANPDSEKPDIEFQLTQRADSSVLLLVSIIKTRSEERDRGTLPAATARLLCELAGSQPNDVFLDPFAGSGAIPLARATVAPYNMIFAGDIVEDFVASFREHIKGKEWEKRRKTIFPKQLDAKDLSRFDPQFFDLIVTDPPWGEFRSAEYGNISELYNAFINQAKRILKPQGVMVLLLARQSPIESILALDKTIWAIEHNWPVLVSGRKASVIKVRLKAVHQIV